LNSFEKNLKIEIPLQKSMRFASQNDTIEIIPLSVTDAFLSPSCPICTCNDEYENYWLEFDNVTGIFLSANPDGFEMRTNLIFKNTPVVFNVKKTNGTYNFFSSLFEEEVNGFNLEVLDEFNFQETKISNVVRITEKGNDNILLQELIYQREIGFLSYINSVEQIEYKRIEL